MQNECIRTHKIKLPYISKISCSLLPGATTIESLITRPLVFFLAFHLTPGILDPLTPYFSPTLLEMIHKILLQHKAKVVFVFGSGFLKLELEFSPV